MKNILILMFLIVVAYGFGQSFSQQHEPNEEETQTQFFSDTHQEPNPDQGVDESPGGPGEPPAPIDDWAFLLPLAAAGIGIYFLRRKQKSEII